MVQFEKRMRESSTLFRDQQRMHDIAQRIAEQNDQILQLLLELNSQPQVPARLRYDLDDPSTVKKPEKHEDEQKALEELRITRHKLQKGDIQQSDYGELAENLLGSVEFAPQRSYAELVRGERLQRIPREEAGSTYPLAGGFLPIQQEELYLQSLDDYFDEKVSDPRQHATGNIGHRTSEKSTDRERDYQLKNPVSVYNWLRKNQPQVFLQDTDHDKAKPAPRSSKRASTTKLPKAEPEMYDDDGIAVEPSHGKGKRKREEDGGYRPKGGHARPVKRRKDETGKSKGTSVDMTS